jgi:hypothetical protein
MRPPFTSAEFFDVFARYHEWLWPAPLVLLALGAGLVTLALVAPRQSRVVVGGLAALWTWMAVMYHFAFFSLVTPMAYAFGALFLVQAGLLAWHGLHTRRLHLARPVDRPSRIVGLLLAAYALVGYPLVAYGLGQRYPAFPTFGLPCPTTILTFALLVWCVHPVPKVLLVIPTAWAVLGVSAAVSFGVGEDLALPIAAALAIAVLRRRHVQEHGAAPPPRRPLQLGF